MTEQKDVVVGELFARQYVTRTEPLEDSPFFRQRLIAYLMELPYGIRGETAGYVRREGGYELKDNGFGSYFASAPTAHVLSVITLVWRSFQAQRFEARALDWREFVARAMREENLAYSVDARCGVHYFVDEEFERNRVTALASLTKARYAAVRAAFDQAHAYLDAQPMDTKAAVRSAFEALEILARLIVPESRNLNKGMIENKLKPIAVAGSGNAVEAAVVGKMLDGLAHFVDGIHFYRHGQGTEEPIAPSAAVAVYVVSSVASALRLLVSVDPG